MRAVLRLSAYRRLLAAYAINELVIGVGSLALAVLVYRRTGSALAAACYFFAAQFLPTLFSAGLVAGLGARPVRTVLPALYAIEALAFVGLAVLAHHFSLDAVLALAFLDGLGALVARSIARTASVDVLTPAGLLREGNAVSNLAFSIAFFVGPAVGGLLAGLDGVRTALLAVAGAFVAMGVLVATKPDLPAPSPERRGIRLRQAWSESRRAPALRRLLTFGALGVMFFTIAMPMEIVLVRRSLHAGTGGYGAMLSVWGGGAVVGSAVYQRLVHRQGRGLIAASASLLGAGLVVMAAAPSLGVAIAGAAVAGVGNGLQVVVYRTEVQERIPERLMSVMVALNESLTQAMYGAGIAVGGAVGAIAGPRPALAVAGVGSLCVAGATWVALGQPVAGAVES